MTWRRASVDLVRASAESPELIGGSGRMRSATNQGQLPELRATPERGGIELSLASTAREVIGGELFALTRSDQMECGGYLFGPQSYSWHKQVTIYRATRTGNAIRTSGSVQLDADEWRRHERAIALEGLDEVMVGTWHSHPATRDCEPSDNDLSALAAILELNRELGRSVAFATGLIYAASEALGDSWTRPTAKAWIARHDRFGRVVCEPAVVRGRL